jgi:hypothetical protein
MAGAFSGCQNQTAHFWVMINGQVRLAFHLKIPTNKRIENYVPDETRAQFQRRSVRPPVGGAGNGAS